MALSNSCSVLVMLLDMYECILCGLGGGGGGEERSPVDEVASKEEGQPSSLFWLLPLWDRGGLNVNRLHADLASCRRCRVGGQSGLVGAVAGGHGLHDATGDGARVLCVCVCE